MVSIQKAFNLEELSIIKRFMYTESVRNVSDRINRDYESVRRKIARLKKNNTLEVIGVIGPNVAYVKSSQETWFCVDVDDFTKVIAHNWSVNSNKGKVYAFNKRMSCVHRFIMQCDDIDLEVDHIDGNGLHNCRYNLRICTKLQNRYNTKPSRNKKNSKYKGVHLFKKLNKYGARIKGVHLGVFNSEIEAAMAYDKAALEAYGEFAYLNFPPS